MNKQQVIEALKAADIALDPRDNQVKPQGIEPLIVCIRVRGYFNLSDDTEIENNKKKKVICQKVNHIPDPAQQDF